MKATLRSAALGALATALLATPAAADTVYYKVPGQTGIESVEGTIVHRDRNELEIHTADGEQMVIAAENIFQVVPSKAGPADRPASGAAAEEGAGEDTGNDSAAGESGAATSSPRASGTASIENSTIDDGFTILRDSKALAEGAPVRKSRRTSATPSLHEYGFKAGMNVANVSADPAELEEGDSLTGFAVGGWWGYPLTRRVSVQTEAFYSVKGDAEEAGGFQAKTKLGYIDVPVLAKVGFLQGNVAKPSFFAGPSVAINVAANSTLTGGDANLEQDVKDRVNLLDFGFVVGTGVEVPLAGQMVGLDVRYTKGLSNVGDGTVGNAYNDVLSFMGSVRLK